MDQGTTRSDAPARAVELVAVVVLVVAAAFVRLPMLSLGYDADEVGTVTDASFRAIFDHPETGVNPPLWRWMWCLAFDSWDAPWWGRRFSFLCSLAAVPLGWLLGRRASGSMVGGLFAGLLLAFHPWAIRYGAMFRVYAFWSAVMLVHVLAMGTALVPEAPRRRAALWVAVITAILLPWIHYMSVPVLLGLGLVVLVGVPGRWTHAFAYAPAAIGTFPLLPYVLFEEGRRVAPDREPLGHVLLKMTSLDLHPPQLVWKPVGWHVAKALGHWPELGEVMAVVVLVLLALGLLAWRHLTPTGRLAVGGHLAVLVGVAALAQVQYVRPPTLVMVVTFAGAALGACVRAIPAGPLRGLLLVGLTAWFGLELRGRFGTEARAWEVERASPAIAARWHEWDAVRGDRPFVISPAHSIWTVWFHLAHEVPRRATRGTVCEGWSPCFEHEGVAWAGVDAVGDGSLVDGVVLHVDAWRPEGFASTCTALVDTGTWGVWDCRREVRAP